MTAPGASAPVRRNVVYAGRVQGVFFRATARDLAQRFAVTGYVRNLPNGTVEMEVEGLPDQVDGLLGAVAQHFRHNITNVTSADRPTRGDEASFQITY
ncbi:MAG: acylphosphatase [Planctomycetes bacterium]|nr:acylphosphatase [Planctomycetota bacterium]